MPASLGPGLTTASRANRRRGGSLPSRASEHHVQRETNEPQKQACRRDRGGQIQRGVGERVADGRSHQRSGAGRGDHHGQNAGEEAARVAVLLRERSAGAGEREADFKLSGEGEAKEEQQHGHDGEEDGGLELESPAELAAGGPKREQHSDHGPERNQNPERVDPAMGAELAAFLLRRLHQRQAFDEEDGEDAGHQVQDDSAEEGEERGGRVH